MAKILIGITIALYLGLMLLIGLFCSKKNKTTSDFYLGGRKLGPIVTAMSAEASDMSGWLLMGLPGVAYLTGLADAAWTAIGLAVGTYFNWLIVAKKIRRYTSATNSITLPDFFSKRFGDKKNLLNAIAAVIIIIFFIPYTASGFAACGKLFSSLFGIEYLPAMIVSAVVIIAYCTMGGFLAASTTDLIQSVVMSIALFAVVLFGINSAGGWNAVMENARSFSGYLSLNHLHDAATDSATDYGFIKILSTSAWGLGYFGMPHILLRFMAVKDDNKLKLSRRVASIWVTISMAVAIFIGVIGLGMSKVGVIPTFATSSDSETVIIKIADLLSSYGAIPAILAGIILSGILASTMSTADSQLLTAASGISQNLFNDVFGIKMSVKTSMLVARISVIAISVLGIILAQDPESSVFEIVSFAWAGFGATFGPVVLAALFWKRATKWGALSGMVVGGVCIFVWKYLVRPLGGAWNIYELLPAFILACITIVIVSLLTKAPEKDVLDTFDQVTASK